MKSFTQKVFAVLAFGALILALMVLIGLWRVNQLITELGVQSLDYRIEKISLHSAQFSRLTFRYQTENSRHDIRAQNLSVQWEWSSVFMPRILSVDTAHLHWQVQRDNNVSSPETTTSLAMPEDWSVPDLIPTTINVRSSQLILPCPAGECQLAARLDVQREGNKVNVRAEISPANDIDQQNIEVTADYQVHQALPELTLQINAGEDIQANLHTALIETESLNWSGLLAVTARYPDDWLRALLAEWHITLDTQWAQTVNQPMDVRAEWQLDVDPLLNINNRPWHHILNGFARVDVDISSPIAVRGVGEFAGNAALHIEAKDGTLEKYEVFTDITVTEPVLPAAGQALGIEFERVHVQARSRADEVSFTELPVQLTIKTAGKLNAQAALSASVDAVAKTFRVPEIDLAAQLKQLQLTPEIQLNNLDMSWHGAADWQKDLLTIRARAPTYVQGDLQAAPWNLSVHGSKIAIEQLVVSAALDKATVDWAGARVEGNTWLTIARLQHPQLHTKPWQWRGALHGSWENFSAEGELTVNNALAISHTIKRSQDDVVADWQLRDNFFLAGNPFADLVKAWPPLLSLAQGKVSGSGQITADINQNNLKDARATVVINEISGVYDTTLFQGATTTLAMAVKPPMFTLATDEVRVKQINKGFIFGPVKAAGRYEAAWQKLTSGTLSLESLYADVIGGSVTTPAQVFDLAKEKQSLVLTLENIDLGMLLQQHPSAELSGSGRISGTVPIEITAEGVSVPKGMVAARPPGGQLQYHSERAEALGRSQPGMKLITDALEDFHYTVLASEVSYDEDGKLLLALRLEGKNPALENGRPVHFNINLEEDLPAMIASIQLSNQISDVVKKRLQEHLQKRSNR